MRRFAFVHPLTAAQLRTIGDRGRTSIIGIEPHDLFLFLGGGERAPIGLCPTSSQPSSFRRQPKLTTTITAPATTNTAMSEDKPPVFNYILGFLLVGLAWGLTTPFIRRAARSHTPPPHPVLDEPRVRDSVVRRMVYGWWFAVVDLLRNPAYVVPLGLNVTGSVWFFLLIGKAGESTLHGGGSLTWRVLQ